MVDAILNYCLFFGGHYSCQLPDQKEKIRASARQCRYVCVATLRRLLSEELLRSMKGMVGFRNVLVHVTEHHLNEPLEFANQALQVMA
jgi:hypothetical protein